MVNWSIAGSYSNTAPWTSVPKRDVISARALGVKEYSDWYNQVVAFLPAMVKLKMWMCVRMRKKE